MADITVNINDVVKSNNVKTFSNKTMSYTQNNITVHTSGVTGYQDTFTICFISPGISPLDSTTYYTGLAAGATTTDTAWDFNVGFAFTIIGVIITVSNNSTAGSNEDATYQIRNTTTATSHSVGTFKTNGSSTVSMTSTYTGLNIAVGASDEVTGQFDAPAYATNPVGMALRVVWICKRT